MSQSDCCATIKGKLDKFLKTHYLIKVKHSKTQ